ncbi:hypothetical protein [Brachyspira sp.]|uniref:hypothetical protein n=1 Tax=Brachyspira sp. TaxID=1977261 RepID=UPI002609711D|nr:hypothetical protein [Brachyspira sp.]
MVKSKNIELLQPSIKKVKHYLKEWCELDFGKYDYHKKALNKFYRPIYKIFEVAKHIKD